MSFRSRLRLFFALIVVVPMTALAIVLFLLTERSETGKVDAGIAAGVRTAFGAYGEAADSAAPALREVAADAGLRAALRSDRGVSDRMRELVRGSGDVVAIELRSPRGDVVARAGSLRGVAHTGAPLSVDGRRVGVLTVSGTDAVDLLMRVSRLTGLELGVFRGGRLLAATVAGIGPRAELGRNGEPRDFQLAEQHFRGRVERVTEPVGPPVEIAVFRDSSGLEDRIARNRLLIGGLLLVFLLLALASAAFVGRALERQLGKFLSAARRLGRGDFAQPVPVEGNDEFAQLGREFNSMSKQLEAKIEEVERKRQELEETIRRVGDALATGLDRDGVVGLAVRTALDACNADGGRACARDGAFRETTAGAIDDRLEGAMKEAEERALIPAANPEAPNPVRRRRVAAAEGDGAHALAIAMRTVVGTGEPGYLGVISIARHSGAFSRDEQELLGYLAGQAAVSIENASLHEAVERQAVTDELTGLANARAFHSILAREIERARRFESSLGLVMVDLDNFKRVNDEYGHQQGDEVLASVAGVLRAFSRDIDAPARYGGEELAVILPQTDAEGAWRLAERMPEAVEALRIPRVGEGGALNITAASAWRLCRRAPPIRRGSWPPPTRRSTGQNGAARTGSMATNRGHRGLGVGRFRPAGGPRWSPGRLMHASIGFVAMGILDDAIREHLDLRRKHGAPEEELQRQEEEALGPARREVASPQTQDANGAGEPTAEEAGAMQAAVPAEADAAGAAAPESPTEAPTEAPSASSREPEAAVDAAVETPREESPPAEATTQAPQEPIVATERPAPEKTSFDTLEPEPPAAEPEPAPAVEALEPKSDTPADGFEALEDDDFVGEEEQPAGDDADVLEDTPDFLQETPEHDRLWFEQKPPRDFDFD